VDRAIHVMACLFVFISSTMRFSRYGLGASSPLITHHLRVVATITTRPSFVTDRSQGPLDLCLLNVQPVRDMLFAKPCYFGLAVAAVAICSVNDVTGALTRVSRSLLARDGAMGQMMGYIQVGCECAH